MRYRQNRKGSHSFQVTLAITLAGVLAGILLAGYAIFSARRIDTHTLARERSAVGLYLGSRLSRIASEQQSITAWDEAVTRIGAADLVWIDENAGAYMQAAFGHDAVFILDAANKPVYAMSAGTRLAADRFAADAATLMPLVEALRRQVHGEAGRADLGVTDIVMVHGRPAMVSVKLVVPYTGKVSVAPGAESIHISVRTIDDRVLSALGEREQIERVHLVAVPEFRGDEGSYRLVSKAGTPLGWVVWRTERPGTQLILETAPALVSLFVLFAGFLLFLVVKLRAQDQERERIEAHTKFLAHHDTLTGLPNRALFDETLTHALAASGVDGRFVALHSVDLDGFKHVNDTLGHPAGDDLIRQVARRLTTAVLGRGTVARLGGDEFAVIQTGVRSPEEAGSLARLMLEAVRAPFQLDHDQAVIGASIGIALATDRAAGRTELMRQADIALYDAKSTGKDRFRLFEPRLDVEVQENRRIERDLRQALEGGEGLRLAYQPLFADDGRTILGAEALLRWDHPVHGPISPSAFVPIAEERGLIVALGDFVLREACRTAREIDLPWIAVNVSATQLKEPLFPRRILELLRDHGLTPNRLQLEITEGVLLEATDSVAQALEQIRALGISVALDDFGTGYSSLQYLHRYPVDKIKIDRSFVLNVAASEQAQALVKAMVDVARAFDMQVVAEGVETSLQRDRLVQLGCGQLQGFLFAEALRVEDLRHIIAGHGAATRATADVSVA
ncbi:putative bifunctional diguanylate cyclase/phosphodiesterase [Antarcticirhabdus aurantiaca]|uniref:EAL domain-containing protein n=1 Tax=Antarcticirhabdus aurantiaca TaxID=2606717 RepID=A0ACD4NIE8_9HYPH|nr:EAL domain-containing protein [Antarcticirhabdus aurantiaca]WAJ26546.1 EAL domain-containing protein [Jeongeuplla avenae]